MALHLSSHYARTPGPAAAANPNDILVLEQMRVSRWLAETVVRAVQATNVDPAYLMVLADKGFQPAARQQGPDLIRRRAIPIR